MGHPKGWRLPGAHGPRAASCLRWLECSEAGSSRPFRLVPRNRLRAAPASSIQDRDPVRSSSALSAGVKLASMRVASGSSWTSGITPVGLAVIRSVSCRHENIARCDVDHRARAPPDTRLRGLAGTRIQQSGAVAAKRVPYMQQLAALRVENGDVTLIGRLVANIARGYCDDMAAVLPQRRGDFLSHGRRVTGVVHSTWPSETASF